MKQLFCLLMLCLLIGGCGSDEPQAGVPDTANNPEPEAPRAELVIEASQASLTTDGIPRDATAILRDILDSSSSLPPKGFTIQIDETFVRSSQLLLVVEPDAANSDASDEALKRASAQTFEQLKASFESQAATATRNELAKQVSAAEQARSEVQALQKALKFFQEAQRVAPKTNESELERRKHKLAIDNALAEQINAEKQVESLQRKIDREQFATLVRIR